MNPVGALGNIPPSHSQQFTLSKIDWQKILRMLLVQVIGIFLSAGVPALLNWHYVYKGVDYTAVVVVVVNTLAEAARRFLSGQPKD
jgi:glycerol uptake facilitator-like aquaporin